MIEQTFFSAVLVLLAFLVVEAAFALTGLAGAFFTGAAAGFLTLSAFLAAAGFFTGTGSTF